MCDNLVRGCNKNVKYYSKDRKRYEKVLILLATANDLYECLFPDTNG